MRRFDGTEIPEADAEAFRKAVNNHRWIFAKTYAAFCPHEYTLRHEWIWDEFKQFVEFIWHNGFDAYYGKIKQRYFIDQETGWYYFVGEHHFNENGEAIRDETLNLINRSNLREFEFVSEESLFGTEYRVKRLPPDRRK